MSNITVSLPDGSERQLADGATALDLAAAIGSGLKKAAVAAVVDGQETDLTAALRDGSTRGDHHGGDGRGPSRAAPLDGPRHGAGGHASCSPARSSPSDRPSRTASTTTSSCPVGRRSATTTSNAIEAEMREIVKANQPFVRSEMTMAEAKQLFADQPYKVEIIERVESAEADDDDAAEVGEGGIISVYRNTDSFVDMCRRPARAVDRQAGLLQAAAGVRRLLARRREGPDAAAHLRHGLGVQAGAGRPSPSARRGAQARPPQAGHGTRPAQFPECARWWPCRLASEGRHRPQADRGLQPAASRTRGLRVRVHAAPGQRQAVRDVGTPRSGTPTACTRRWRWTTARTT